MSTQTTPESIPLIHPDLARPHVTDEAELSKFKKGEAIVIQTRSMRQVMRAMIAGNPQFKDGIQTLRGVKYDNPQAIKHAALELEDTHKEEIALYYKVTRAIEQANRERVSAMRNRPKEYREDLPKPIPKRLLKLPTERGYPVPWFVAQLEDGSYDFRIKEIRKLPIAVNKKLCWLCGESLGKVFAFLIGPMCAISKSISEPPAHRECAEWSAKACPFLNQTETRRRESNMPEGSRDAAGTMIKRQPGAVCLWVTDTYRVSKVENGVLFNLSNPLEVKWYAEGRNATRREVMDSIESGFPLLIKSVHDDLKDDYKNIADLTVALVHEKDRVYRELLPNK